MKALVAYAARRDQSRSLVAEAAIASFLSPDAAGRQEAATTKQLDQPDRRMTRMERELGISVEMVAVFFRVWQSSRSSCCDKELQYVSISVGAVPVKKKKKI